MKRSNIMCNVVGSLILLSVLVFPSTALSQIASDFDPIAGCHVSTADSNSEQWICSSDITGIALNTKKVNLTGTIACSFITSPPVWLCSVRKITYYPPRQCAEGSFDIPLKFNELSVTRGISRVYSAAARQANANCKLIKSQKLTPMILGGQGAFVMKPKSDPSPKNREYYEYTGNITYCCAQALK